MISFLHVLYSLKYLFCICKTVVFSRCILSKPRREVSEAEEMLVTQMSNVAGNEIAFSLAKYLKCSQKKKIFFLQKC